MVEAPKAPNTGAIAGTTTTRAPMYGTKPQAWVGPAPAAGEDGELARIVPLQRHLVEHLLAHAGVHQPAHAVGGLQDPDAQRPGDLLLDGRAGEFHVERHLPVEVVVRIEVPQHQVGVGHGRLALPPCRSRRDRASIRRTAARPRGRFP